MCTHPEQQLYEHDVAERGGDVQRRARVALAVGRVDVSGGGVGEHEYGAAHVLARDGVDELLRHGHVVVGQRRQEALLLVLQPNPLLLLLTVEQTTRVLRLAQRADHAC